MPETRPRSIPARMLVNGKWVDVQMKVTSLAVRPEFDPHNLSDFHPGKAFQISVEGEVTIPPAVSEFIGKQN